MKLPYLTSDFAGIGGTLKNRVEDFFVQEVPLYEPSGVGEHVYIELQKVGISTFEAIHRISRALRVPEKNIGYAGLKDARAVTRQVFSVSGTTEAAAMDLRLPDITVQYAARHGNKLRLGHLAGNRFAVKVRDVRPTDVTRLRPVLDTIERRGMPNFFGEQRFGRRGNNQELGAALVANDDERLLSGLLGSPNVAVDSRDGLAARAAFDAKDYETAARLYPPDHGLERRTLDRLSKTGKSAAAVGSIDEKLRRLWVSALQSHIFNNVVADRIASLDQLMTGDLAYRHDSGACFDVESAADEQPRCERFEISPTGPLIGSRMDSPLGAPLDIERHAMATFGITGGDFRNSRRGDARGARRPLRIRPTEITLEAGVDEHGGFITVAFTLPAGSYATVLMRELMKSDSPDGRGGAESRPASGDEGSDAQHDEHGAQDGHHAET